MKTKTESNSNLLPRLAIAIAFIPKCRFVFLWDEGNPHLVLRHQWCTRPWGFKTSETERVSKHEFIWSSLCKNIQNSTEGVLLVIVQNLHLKSLSRIQWQTSDTTDFFLPWQLSQCLDGQNHFPVDWIREQEEGRTHDKDSHSKRRAETDLKSLLDLNLRTFRLAFHFDSVSSRCQRQRRNIWWVRHLRQLVLFSDTWTGSFCFTETVSRLTVKNREPEVEEKFFSVRREAGHGFENDG